jgi:hypothetical protein
MKPEINTTRQIVYDAATHRDTSLDMLFKDSEAWKKFANKRWVSCKDEVEVWNKILLRLETHSNIISEFTEGDLDFEISIIKAHIKHLEGK